ALSEAAEQAMFTKGMEIHIRQRTMKKDLESLSSADEILAYRVGWAQE
ncbi:phage tail protein, partial [Escherichia coli]|nr:phage tail protein [Escherichia coli]EHX1456133.1 phage tail protein [Escherichia coli]EIF9485088.1 phage tail protein [Escherichia coli]EIH7382539.1 phage tail protein [Escherichia coli]EIW7380966.1 phage tail protein [Escherichia coli]